MLKGLTYFPSCGLTLCLACFIRHVLIRHGFIFAKDNESKAVGLKDTENIYLQGNLIMFTDSLYHGHSVASSDTAASPSSTQATSLTPAPTDHCQAQQTNQVSSSGDDQQARQTELNQKLSDEFDHLLQMTLTFDPNVLDKLNEIALSIDRPEQKPKKHMKFTPYLTDELPAEQGGSGPSVRSNDDDALRQLLPQEISVQNPPALNTNRRDFKKLLTPEAVETLAAGQRARSASHQKNPEIGQFYDGLTGSKRVAYKCFYKIMAFFEVIKESLFSSDERALGTDQQGWAGGVPNDRAKMTNLSYRSMLLYFNWREAQELNAERNTRLARMIHHRPLQLEKPIQSTDPMDEIAQSLARRIAEERADELNLTLDKPMSAKEFAQKVEELAIEEENRMRDSIVSGEAKRGLLKQKAKQIVRDQLGPLIESYQDNREELDKLLEDIKTVEERVFTRLQQRDTPLGQLRQALAVHSKDLCFEPQALDESLLQPADLECIRALADQSAGACGYTPPAFQGGYLVTNEQLGTNNSAQTEQEQERALLYFYNAEELGSFSKRQLDDYLGALNRDRRALKDEITEQANKATRLARVAGNQSAGAIQRFQRNIGAGNQSRRLIEQRANLEAQIRLVESVLVKIS